MAHLQSIDGWVCMDIHLKFKYYFMHGCDRLMSDYCQQVMAIVTSDGSITGWISNVSIASIDLRSIDAI